MCINKMNKSTTKRYLKILQDSQEKIKDKTLNHPESIQNYLFIELLRLILERLDELEEKIYMNFRQ